MFSCKNTHIVLFFNRKELPSDIKEIIAVCVSLCGIVAYIVKISFNFAKLKERQQESEKDILALQNNNENVEKSTALVTNKISTLEVFIQNNTKRLEDNELKNSQKFTELFTSRNNTNEVLAELNTTIRMLVQNMNKKFDGFDKQFEKLDNKIEELKRGK